MIGELPGNGEYAAIQGRIAQAVDCVFRDELQRHEIPTGTADVHLRINDFHGAHPHRWFAMSIPLAVCLFSGTSTTVHLRSTRFAQRVPRCWSAKARNWSQSNLVTSCLPVRMW